MTEIHRYSLVGGCRTSDVFRRCRGTSWSWPETGCLTDVLVVLASLSRQTLKLGHDHLLKISSNLLLTNDRPGRVFATASSLK